MRGNAWWPQSRQRDASRAGAGEGQSKSVASIALLRCAMTPAPAVE
jgi:hypothetical protein